ncbi:MULTISPECIES: AraC family transcriptional regulator [Paenibacillus]|uniref:AraC family transcriptional regulator n=1 Tax=Paenibacillus TaxID=44249 RepID=UPI0022B87C82|nr:AraC family transcriptional regulator [Paenibacillus caseinilyticus]MCZ8518574.1 AraC family transcriptional regulator [Paenibacillus caseinilyticus]
MPSPSPYGVYGFRFQDTPADAFYQLFAVGYEKQSGPSYSWDGEQRSDGPLLLLQYTVSGHGYLDIAGREYRIDPGRAFLVEIPSKHRYYASPQGEPWEFYFVLFRPYGLAAHWKRIVAAAGPAAAIPPDNPVVHLLQDTYHAAARGRITDGYLASSLVYRLVMELLRFCTARRREKEYWPPAIRSAALQLEQRYADLPGMEEIAAGAGMSTSHFTRSFRRATGYTPIEYVTKLRIEASFDLLRRTPLPVEEVAKAVGYSGGSYFSRVFREWVGFSPGDFRSGREVTALEHVTFD